MREAVAAMTAGMTTAHWMAMPVEPVHVDRVVPMHPLPLDCKDWPHLETACADPYVHVVVIDGIPVLEDGHHRLAAARLAGQVYILARVLT